MQGKAAELSSQLKQDAETETEKERRRPCQQALLL